MIPLFAVVFPTLTQCGEANMSEIEEKKPEEPVVEIVEAPKDEKKVVSVEDGLGELKKQLEAERIARAEAERRAAEAARQAHRAQNEVEDTNLQLVNNAIETVKSNTANLKGAYAQAMAAGDFERAADIQLAMSDNAAKLLQLENGKQAMQDRPKQAAPQPKTDPVEALASQLTPRSAAWVRAHPQYATDPRLYQKMIAAHNMVMADGHQADSDDYFSAVENVLGVSRQANNDDDGTEMAAKVVSRRSSPPAAPVSRSGSAPGTSPKVIRLTSEEAEIARLSKMTDKEYWEMKQKVKNDGRYN